MSSKRANFRYNRRGSKYVRRGTRNDKVMGTRKDMLQDKQLKNLNKKIKRVEKDAEVKWVDEYSANNIVNNVGLVNNPLSPNPIQGDGVSNRQGNVITITSWHIKAIFLSQPGFIGPTRIRCMVVIDLQFNGANPVLGGTILDNTTITDLTLSPRNMNQVKRFKIIYDKMFYLQPYTVQDYDPVTGNTSTVVSRGHSINIFNKIRHRIQFVSNGGTTADLTGFVPLFYVVSDRAVLSGQEPVMAYSGRVNYKDF